MLRNLSARLGVAVSFLWDVFTLAAFRLTSVLMGGTPAARTADAKVSEAPSMGVEAPSMGVDVATGVMETGVMETDA